MITIVFILTILFKDQCIKYLQADLPSLYQVLTKANKQIFQYYNVNMTDKITISGLAVDIFLKNCYNKNIPIINKKVCTEILNKVIPVRNRKYYVK